MLSRTARERIACNDRRKVEDLKRCGGDLLADHPDLLDYEAAGKILGLSPKTVESLCSAGKLGYIKRVWRHGVFYRSKRLIPAFALVQYLNESGRYFPPKPPHAKTPR